MSPKKVSPDKAKRKKVRSQPLSKPAPAKKKVTRKKVKRADDDCEGLDELAGNLVAEQMRNGLSTWDFVKILCSLAEGRGLLSENGCAFGRTVVKAALATNLMVDLSEDLRRIAVSRWTLEFEAAINAVLLTAINAVEEFSEQPDVERRAAIARGETRNFVQASFRAGGVEMARDVVERLRERFEQKGKPNAKLCREGAAP